MRNNKLGLFVVLLSLILALAVVWSYYLRKSVSNDQLRFIEFSPTPTINPTADIEFLETVDIDLPYELNTGLIIERIGAIAIEGIPTPSVNYISLLILNHTQEPIVFDDIGFGIQVFQYDLETSKWKKVILPYIPEKKQKILPPKTENFDFNILNSWEFNDRDLINVNTSTVRIFIAGLGVNSNKNYSSYVDVTLQK